MRPLKHPLLWLSLAWSYVALVAFLSLIPDPPRIMEFEQSDKLKHLSAYFLMMAAFCQLYVEPRLRRRHALIFIFLGCLIEVLQGLGGVRSMELLDAVANACGVGLGLLAGPRLPLYKALSKA